MKKELPINSSPSIITCIHHAYPLAIIEASQMLRLSMNEDMGIWNQYVSNAKFNIDYGKVTLDAERFGRVEGVLWRECRSHEEIVLHVEYNRPRDVARYIDVFLFDGDVREEIDLEDKKCGVRWNPFGYFLEKEMHGIDTKTYKYVKLEMKDDKVYFYGSVDGLNWVDIGSRAKKYHKKLKLGIHAFMGDDKYYEWKNMNFIQLNYNPFNEYKGIIVDYFAFPRKNVDNSYMYFINYIDTCYETTYEVLDIFGDYVKYLKWQIDHEYYVVICLDEFYVPQRLKYQKGHYNHYNMIYGYDDEKQIFYIMGYGANGNPVVSEIPYSVFKEDVVTSEKITRYKYATNEVTQFRFDANRVIHELEHLYSDTRSDTDYSNLLSGEKLEYGIGILKELAFTEIGKWHVRHDKRIAFCIKEHSELMKQRIDFLERRSLIDAIKANELRLECDELIQKGTLLLTLVLKNYVKPVSDGRINDLLLTLYDSEKSFLEKLINELKVECLKRNDGK